MAVQTLVRARNARILSKTRQANALVIRRRFVDRLFDAYYNEADPQKSWELLREAAKESQIYERLLEESQKAQPETVAAE